MSTARAILNTIKGSAGNLVEWYDVYIYTVFALYFEAQFFDSADKNSTIYIYGDLRGHLPDAAGRARGSSAGTPTAAAAAPR